jgi:hypothetical protein
MGTREIEQICLVILGGMFAVMAFAIKKFFWSRTLHGAALSDRPFPTWAARLAFLIFGLIMIVAGIKGLIVGR